MGPRHKILGLVFLVAAGICAVFIAARSSSYDVLPSDAPADLSPSVAALSAPSVPAVLVPRVEIGSVVIPVEPRKTPEELAKGLSGRTSLDKDKGMLFLFSFSSIYRFWMPDMHFPIDIIWIDGGKIVDISANISNVLDPEKPKFYTPSVSAQYVLEVNAGFAEQNNISVGDSIVFKDITL